jgi:hypothetical protein
VARVYESAGVSGTRRSLLGAIDRGARIVDFVGHGNLEEWGYPPPLLSVQDVPRLRSPAPALFLGWGCQTAYDVDPGDEALNARLLFASRGAAVAIGSTGLDLAEPQSRLAVELFKAMFHERGDITVGDALMRAENRALGRNADALPAVQSYELFGDPAIPVEAFH